MRKFFLSLLLISFSALLFAQETKNEPVSHSKSESKSVEFLSNKGLFVLKEYYDLGKIKGMEIYKGIHFEMDCKVLILTDIKNNTKISCLKLETTDGSFSNKITYTGTIDADELDDCIQILEYISSNLLSTRPAVYTEVEYRTRDFVKIGAFYNDKTLEWKVFCFTESSSNSGFYINPSEIANLKGVFERAKYVIRDKTSK
jgi:hypothetical protein